MIVGNITKLTNATVTVDDTPITGKEGINILDNNILKVWESSASTPSILVELEPVSLDAITLHNINVRTSITVDVYSEYPSKLLYTETIKATSFSGFFNEHAYIKIPNTINSEESAFILDEFILDEYILGTVSNQLVSAIKITFNGGEYDTNPSLGYIWAGDIIDFGCAEKMNTSDQATDDVTFSRTNHPDVNERYDYRAYTVTLKKTQELDELRTNIRKIFDSGFALPRPFIFKEEPLFDNTEVLLGVLDSNKVGYDMLQVKDNDGNFSTLSMATIGIREIF